MESAGFSLERGRGFFFQRLARMLTRAFHCAGQLAWRLLIKRRGDFKGLAGMNAAGLRVSVASVVC